MRFKEIGNMVVFIYWRVTYYIIGKGWGLGVLMELLFILLVIVRMIEIIVIGFVFFRKKGIYRCGREEEREKERERIGCVFGILSGVVRGIGVD